MKPRTKIRIRRRKRKGSKQYQVKNWTGIYHHLKGERSMPTVKMLLRQLYHVPNRTLNRKTADQLLIMLHRCERWETEQEIMHDLYRSVRV